MTVQLRHLASMVAGRLVGDGEAECCGANPPEDAIAGEIALLDDPARRDSILRSRAAAVVTPVEMDFGDRAQLVVEDPHGAFATIVAHFRPPVDAAVPRAGIDRSARIADSAAIHASVTIAAGVTIGERVRIFPGVVVGPKCQIGDDCVLYPQVTLYEYTRLAERVVIHAGTVIGAHGFGYRQDQGRHVPTAQLGYVEIARDVEIGASVTIDRGTYGATFVGEGTKIDNQVMIAHNCRIGRHNLLCSQVGIAGSCRTGDHVVLAGQVGLKDHITLGDRTVVGAQAGVMEDCEGNQVYLGSPATTQREQMQIMAVERRLPEMRRDVKSLRRDVDRLQQQASRQQRPAA